MTAAGNLRGSAFMVAAMAGFAVEDMFLKAAAAELPVGQILILFGGLGMLAFAGFVRAEGGRLLHPAILSPPVLIRAGFEVSGRLFYTLAIALTPLSLASAILHRGSTGSARCRCWLSSGCWASPGAILPRGPRLPRCRTSSLASTALR